MPTSIVEFLKKVEFQYIKDIDEGTISDEQRVEDAVSILNAQLDDHTITDAEMPVTFLGVNLNWAEGSSENDSIVRFTFGDFDLIQDLTLPTENVRLRMPTNFQATYNVLEESVQLTWDEVTSASGYRVVRDFSEASETVVLDGSSGYSAGGGVISFTDTTGDNIEHTYIVLAKDADPNDHSEYTESISGKGYSVAAVPTGLTASYNTLEEGVDLSWTASANATGYTIRRDSTVIATNYNSTYWRDSFIGDNLEHTYTIKAEGEVDAADSTYSSGVSGKGYSQAAVPTGLSASTDTLEEAVSLSWTASDNATGYTIRRDSTVIATNHQGTSYTDNVGDNSTHTYTIKSEGEVSIANSAYSTGVNGKGYSLITQNINLSNYSSTTVSTPSNSFDINLSGDIAGTEGGAAYYITGGFNYNWINQSYLGLGGKGVGYSFSPSPGSHSFFFGSSRNGWAGSQGYESGGQTYQSGGDGSGSGGGASRVVMDSMTICGAGGGGGAPHINSLIDGAGGGGTDSLGENGRETDSIPPSGGSPNGGAGAKADPIITAGHGSATVFQGTFSSTGTNSGDGYINMILTWKE